MPSPPTLPSKQVVLYDCLSGELHQLGSKPLVLGGTTECDVQLGATGFKGSRLRLARSGKNLELAVVQGNHELVINGSPFDGGLLPYQEEFSLVVDKLAFFLVRTGETSREWEAELKKAPKNSWQLRIIEGGISRFKEWKEKGCPANYSGSYLLEKRTLNELYDEVNKRDWSQQTGVVYHNHAKAGFFAHQFVSIAKPEQIPDAGDNRCPRCWMRFDTGRILAIHPNEYGDEILGEQELKRFLPSKFNANGTPLTLEDRPCSRLACPHCRGELPPNFMEKPPHLLSIVGDSMAGKSYFLTVAVNQLQAVLRKKLEINFTDGDPKGNAVLSKMVARLFSPSENPLDTYLEKTELVGATYKTFRRYGKLVKLPAPFTYNLLSKKRGAASLVLYDNAGEHFRPGFSETEKSDVSEHIAWASGILFLFDPLQHRNLLRLISPKKDPQVAKMKGKASELNFDQDIILSEMGERLRSWRQSSHDQSQDIPLAIVVGKHDILGDLLALDHLKTDVCLNGMLSAEAIESNSRITLEFLMEHCPDIVAAADAISSNVKYFPASSFGCSATIFNNKKNEEMIGPDPILMKPYLVEAPFLWLLSEFEPNLVPTN